ncbi:MAG: CBS domain-containing protein [Candidatus Aenigmatarchaeota archaeon]
MLVKDLMNKKIVYCYENDSLLKAVRKLLKYNISGMPVVDKNKKLKGIISITDIINYVEKKMKTEISLKSSLWEFSLFIFQQMLEANFLKKLKFEVLRTKVKEIMKKDVLTIEENKTIGEAIEIMKKNDISRLIVTKNSKVVGILTKTDILKYLLK